MARTTNERIMAPMLLLSLVSVLAHSVSGTSDPSLPFTSFQHFSLDLIDSSNDPTAPNDGSSLQPSVTASQMYDGGCLVSSHAIMISGGESFFTGTTTGLSNTNHYQHNNNNNKNNEDSDDDDNDDDNDGQSSMLSNASLRRSKRPAAGDAKRTPFSSTNTHHTAMETSTRYDVRTSALSVRGGASTDVASEFAQKLLVAAIVTLGYEAIIGHMLEFVKIVMQTAPDGTSYFDVLKLITSEKGIGGIWDGFVPWGVVQAVFKGGVFGLAHAIALSLLLPLVDQGKLPKQLALTLAGGIGGGFQGYVLSPTLLLKTRVMTNPVFRENMSMLKTTLLSFRIGVDVVKDEGIMALMKGSNIFATKRVFDWATRYYFADVFEALLRARKGGAALSATDKIVSSFVGGTLSTLSTLPLDVLVAKTQDAKKAGVKVSALTLFHDELKEKGWSGLCSSYMRGFEARLLHVCFTTVAMKTGTAIVFDALYGKDTA